MYQQVFGKKLLYLTIVAYVCMELHKKLTLMDMWCSNNRVERKKFERFILNDMLIL